MTNEEQHYGVCSECGASGPANQENDEGRLGWACPAHPAATVHFYAHPLDPTPLEKLRKLLPEGSTVHVVTKHTTRGNTSSTIDFFRFYLEPCGDCDGDGTEIDECGGLGNDSTYKPCSTCGGSRGRIQHFWLSRMMCNACDDLRFDANHEGIRVGGVGHNRAMYVLSKVSRALYGREDALRMERL